MDWDSYVVFSELKRILIFLEDFHTKYNVPLSLSLVSEHVRGILVVRSSKTPVVSWVMIGFYLGNG